MTYGYRTQLIWSAKYVDREWLRNPQSRETAYGRTRFSEPVDLPAARSGEWPLSDRPAASEMQKLAACSFPTVPQLRGCQFPPSLRHAHRPQ